MPVQNAEIAAMFDQTADLLEFKGENQFRVRAYHRAARTIEGLPQSVRSLLSAQKDLTELPGHRQGSGRQDRRHRQERAFRSAGSAEEAAARRAWRNGGASGLGPKRIKLLYDKLKVRTLDDLRRAIKAGRLHEAARIRPDDGKETCRRAGKAGGRETLQARGGGSRSRGAGRVSARRRPRRGGRQLSAPPRDRGRSRHSGHVEARGGGRR